MATDNPRSRGRKNPLLTLKLSISLFWLGHRSEEKTFVVRIQPRPQGAFPWLWSGREKPLARFRSLKKLTLISVHAMKDGPTRQ